VDKFTNDLQDFDPIKVGVNLRFERNKAGFSISKLAQDVKISAGKISYLENGQRSKMQIDDIQSIADALNIPISNILNDDALIKPPIEKYYGDIDLILQFIAAGLLNEAPKLIDVLKQKLNSTESKWLQPALLFIEAELHISSGESDKAMQTFSFISNMNGHHTLLNHYKVRALNALACNSFKKHHITDAILYTKRALMFSDKNLSAEQRSNTYYNMSLLYGLVGYTDIAIMHGKNAEILSHDNTVYLTEIRFSLGILYMIQEDTEEAISYISEALGFYQKIKDITSIGNMYKCFYTLYRIDPHKYALVRTFFELDYLSVLNSDSVVQIDYLHTWIELMLEQNQFDHIGRYIDFCIETVDKMPARINYKTYWLASIFYKMTKQPIEMEHALSTALNYLDQSMVKEKAMILFELAKLREPESNSLYFEVSSLFQTFINDSERNRTLDQLLNLIPSLRY
jgi:transcriptional regulator with XRE-family HTH domain